MFAETSKEREAHKKREAGNEADGEARFAACIASHFRPEEVPEDPEEELGVYYTSSAKNLHKRFADIPVAEIVYHHWKTSEPLIVTNKWGEKVEFTRSRYLTDELPVDEDGREIKYIQLPGTKPEAYFDPNVNWPAIFADPTIPLRFVEGEFKAQALCRLGFITIGLGGVWNFEKDGIPIAELKRAIWMDRIVYTAYDSDVLDPNKPGIKAAEDRLVNLLASWHANVKRIRIPDAEDGTRQGADDYLLTHTNDEWAALEARAVTNEIKSPRSHIATLTADQTPREFVWDGFIPEGKVTLLISKGGLGKTMLMIALCQAVSMGAKFLGIKTKKQAVLAMFSEDDSKELHFRGKDISEDMGVIPGIYSHSDATDFDPDGDIDGEREFEGYKIVTKTRTEKGKRRITTKHIKIIEPRPFTYWTQDDEINPLLAVVSEDGSSTLKEFLHALEARIIAIGEPCFIVLDSLADMFHINENSRQASTAAIKDVLQVLCSRYGCTMVVLAHTSKGSVADRSYQSGSTGWIAAVRSQIVLKSADEFLKDLIEDNPKVGRFQQGKYEIMKATNRALLASAELAGEPRPVVPKLIEIALLKANYSPETTIRVTLNKYVFTKEDLLDLIDDEKAFSFVIAEHINKGARILNSENGAPSTFKKAVEQKIYGPIHFAKVLTDQSGRKWTETEVTHYFNMLQDSGFLRYEKGRDKHRKRAGFALASEAQAPGLLGLRKSQKNEE